MSIHKLTAGSGYDYLTRQVAALDATDKGHTGLARYYAARGESPGRWVGTGLGGIDGLNAGDVVTAEQMQSLFGSGHHPLAHQRLATATQFDEELPTRLGVPFKVYTGEVGAFRLEVAARIAAINAALGHPHDDPVSLEQRAAVRTQVAREFFAAEHGRDPVDAREIAATVAKHSRPKTTAVAGYDLTFSPVKSVSTLWAVAPREIAVRIERAHQAAVADALAFVEAHALYTRTGANGVRQVDVQGLVAAAFTHRDSRAGDPDLHTHVAVANKVQTGDGRWLSIDGRVLFKATVAASETYNTALETHLCADLGVQFASRAQSDPRKRSVREIVGVDPRLNAAWSRRRADIEERRGQLATAFQATHGRPPTPVESVQLAQQATLETREAKHEPRNLAEQRATWSAQAQEILGDQGAVDEMVTAALNPAAPAPCNVNIGEVVATTADRVLAVVEAQRATWQTWHVRAEAHRQVRAHPHLPSGTDVSDVVEQVVREVLYHRSVSLARPEPGIIEPDVLRRADGASAYTVAGADLFTSANVLAAERRLVRAAGRRDGRVADPALVDLTLLESTANGVPLNAGQAHLVRQVASSGARLQLAIAPAGTGKTTTMRALAQVWADSGGTVIGLAPSAAAADALREQIGVHTDTLAKLVWSLEHSTQPEWAQIIGPDTLVVIDEAGMADTLSLDTAVEFVIARGGSVRLVGDDQQLSAIGAGGVLRDIRTTHGAARLSELMRFADPAEAAATLALREGGAEALGFYLDRGRVHVGDMATMTTAVFDAWTTDRAHGLDALMLAPTRDLVAQLNRRARDERLSMTGASHGRTVKLPDGNTASAGDLVISRRNDRRLRAAATDWVKNGDRWTVREVRRDGSVRAQHARTGRLLTLPAGYVRESVELGYAVTVHGAQGVSVDTMHGLVSGEEARQHLYTMMTRGALANHVYLEVVGDGDSNAVIRPEFVHPRTATDLLEEILARDEAPVSASTTLSTLEDPAAQLGPATTRYVDALQVAAEQMLGPKALAALERDADQVVPGLTAEPAWPTLRAHLVLLGAHHIDPIAATVRELDTAADRAAVLDWRLDDTGLRSADRGPLPWTPGIPGALAQHPQWGPYLQARSARVTDLATRLRNSATHGVDVPAWAVGTPAERDRALLASVTVWRAATEVPDTDRRPTGPPQVRKVNAAYQERLDRALALDDPAAGEWGHMLHQVAPGVRKDPFTTQLARRLAAVAAAGINAPGLLVAAAAQGPLPDDHIAAALWWRISDHLSPAVIAEVTAGAPVNAAWVPELGTVIGTDRTAALQASPMWPTLVATIDRAIQAGWRLPDLVAQADTAEDHLDQAQALIWRITVLLDPVPNPTGYDEPSPPHEEPAGDWWTPPPAGTGTPVNPWPHPQGHRDAMVDAPTGVTIDVEQELALAAMVRSLPADPLHPSEEQIQRWLDDRDAWHEAPVTRDRLLAVNAEALRFYEEHLVQDGSWVRAYLTDRLRVDLAGDPRFRPGHAPAGWTHLVDHLHCLGFTDTELLEAGVATTTRTGRLIDRFRDRAVFPIVRGEEILGFVGRRHPDVTDAGNAGPKYLNTPNTLLYRKGAQLYGPLTTPDADATPVLVEGPLDAIAVTVATGGSHVGYAPLGTALTDDQATQLNDVFPTHRVVVATDADVPGQLAAERAYWALVKHRIDPLTVRTPAGTDPAQILADQGPTTLTNLLVTGVRPLADELLRERTLNLDPDPAIREAVHVIAALPPHEWNRVIEALSNHTGAAQASIRAHLLAAIRGWTNDPRSKARAQLEDSHPARGRQDTATATQQPPERRGTPPVSQVQPPQTPGDPDWPAQARMLGQAGSRHGNALLPRVTDQKAPEAMPEQELPHRFAITLQEGITDHAAPAEESAPAAAQTRSTEARPEIPYRHNPVDAPTR